MNAIAVVLLVLLAGCATPPGIVENSLGMRFVRIPAGTFLMGSDESPASLAHDFPHYDPVRFSKLDDEASVHSVNHCCPVKS